MHRNVFRDVLRSIRVARHLRRHGPVFDYRGLAVHVPPGAGLSAMNALVRGKYERAEASMIERHLPPGLPVIELGGSLGVVSRLVRARIGPDARHLVVEANADLIAICRRNATDGAGEGATEVLLAALHHGGPEARFRIGRDIHSNALDAGEGGGELRTVPAVTLSMLVERLGDPAAYSLVADVEGAEYVLFEREGEALSRAAVVIVEIHPRRFAAMGGSEAAFMALAARAGLALIDRQDDVLVLTPEGSRPVPRP